MRTTLSQSVEKRFIRAVDAGIDPSLIRERFGLSQQQYTGILARIRRMRREALPTRPDAARQSDPSQQQDAAGG